MSDLALLTASVQCHLQFARVVYDATSDASTDASSSARHTTAIATTAAMMEQHWRRVIVDAGDGVCWERGKRLQRARVQVPTMKPTSWATHTLRTTRSTSPWHGVGRITRCVHDAGTPSIAASGRGGGGAMVEMFVFPVELYGGAFTNLVV